MKSSGKGYGKDLFMMMRQKSMKEKICIVSILLVSFAACASVTDTYHSPNMDFGVIQTVAVMPFGNLSMDKMAGERVRDALIIRLLSTEAFYVLPPGEVARGIDRARISNPFSPSTEEVTKLAGILKIDALITGVVREYGTLKSGTASANVISLSLQMIETQTGRIVWTASSTKGGISVWDRLFGGGGKSMNDITEKAINDLLNKLF